MQLFADNTETFTPFAYGSGTGLPRGLISDLSIYYSYTDARPSRMDFYFTSISFINGRLTAMIARKDGNNYIQVASLSVDNPVSRTIYQLEQVGAEACGGVFVYGGGVYEYEGLQAPACIDPGIVYISRKGGSVECYVDDVLCNIRNNPKILFDGLLETHNTELGVYPLTLDTSKWSAAELTEAFVIMPSIRKLITHINGEPCTGGMAITLGLSYRPEVFNAGGFPVDSTPDEVTTTFDAHVSDITITTNGASWLEVNSFGVCSCPAARMDWSILKPSSFYPESGKMPLDRGFILKDVLVSTDALVGGGTPTFRSEYVFVPSVLKASGASEYTIDVDVDGILE